MKIMLMLPVFESERLLMLPWIPEVDAAVFANYENPKFPSVLSYEDYNTQEENNITMQEFLEESVNHCNELNDGKGLWAIIEKQTQQLIGGILIKKLDNINDNSKINYEIGWHIHQ